MEEAVINRPVVAITIFTINALVVPIIFRYNNLEPHLSFVAMVSSSALKCLTKATEPKQINFTDGTDVSPIVDVLYGSLYQFAVHLTRSESDAADLVQQTFLILIQRLPQIRDYSKIKYWLFTTLRRNFLIQARRRKKYSEVEFLPDVHNFETGDPEAWRSLDVQRLREALLQVEPMYGTALELFYRSNLSYREISKALGIPIGTVMSRLSRGKEQLRSILSTNYNP